MIIEILPQRFWDKVIYTSEHECWGWKGAKRKGYGRIGTRPNYTANAHRFSWELHNKQEIPEGLKALHRCDNRECTNPNHLFLGTDLDNALDKTAKGRNGTLSGIDSPNAKLTIPEVLEIRRLYKLGIEQRDIAKLFEICQATVWQITSYRTWKHLP